MSRELYKDFINTLYLDGKLRLNEANVLKPKYKPGHQVVINSNVSNAFLSQTGTEVGDVLTVTDEEEADISYGDGEYVKYLATDEDKIIKLAGSQTSYGSYFTHLKNGKQMPSGEDWESLLIVAFNNGIEDGSPEWERAEKYWADYGEDAKGVAKALRKYLTSQQLKQLGASTAALNPDWGGSNKTPKTDILGDSKENISLKKAGGSQLMSGGKDETISTFKAAMEMVGENKPRILSGFIDSLEDKMGKMTEKGTITQLKKLRDKGEELTDRQKKAIAEMEKLQLNIEEINRDMKPLFEDSYFKTCFCFEAATGTHKFADKDAIANQLIEFNPGKGTITKHLPMQKIEDASTLASQNRFYAAFKTAGAAPYVVLRTGKVSKSNLKKEGVEKVRIPTFATIVKEEFSKSEMGKKVLTEANLEQLNEFQIFNSLVRRLRDVSSKVVDQARNIVEGIMKRVKDALNFIKKLGKKIFTGIMNFLGIEIDYVRISTSPPFPLIA